MIPGPSFVNIYIYSLAFVVTAQTNIEFLSKPVIFGETAKLSCTVNTTKVVRDNSDSRSWKGGPLNALMCTDGVCTDHRKYHETLVKDQHQVILEIHNFSESDVDCDYCCMFGAESIRRRFELNERDYAFHPTKEMIIVKSDLQRGHFTIDIKFGKVWPTPVCEIMFEGINFVNRTSISNGKNGKLYSTSINLEHRFRSDFCSGETFVSCRIGTKHIEVHRKRFHTCPVSLTENPGDQNNMPLMSILIVGLLICMVMSVYVLLMLIRHNIFIKNISDYLTGKSYDYHAEIKLKQDIETTEEKVGLTLKWQKGNEQRNV
ncbi:uncharacterized protein LOC127711243 [Mytilus californianus]|uniref:uncharacterized protein LOC127711243 n=1 Tax=Mytilus californianus TaxID=6549 RepID=UPI00224874B6|nr:uncharacterized protein LOC127711243 [Mytilus californianus]